MDRSHTGRSSRIDQVTGFQRDIFGNMNDNRLKVKDHQSGNSLLHRFPVDVESEIHRFQICELAFGKECRPQDSRFIEGF